MSTARKLKTRYTWRQLRAWPTDERWELIGGGAFCMSPGPSVRHQAIVGDVYAAFREAFAEGRCRPFVAPLDVRLSDEDVVQPDVMVVCDPEQIRPTHVEGAPSLIVEVVSRSSVSHDRVRKLRLYAKFGVAEYWLASPNPSVIEVLLLDGARYVVHGVYRSGERVQSATFAHLAVDVDRLFTLPLPPGEEIDEIREASDPPYGS